MTKGELAKRLACIVLLGCLPGSALACPKRIKQLACLDMPKPHTARSSPARHGHVRWTVGRIHLKEVYSPYEPMGL